MKNLNRSSVKASVSSFRWVLKFAFRELYVQWSSNQTKNAFNDPTKIFSAFLTNHKIGENGQKVARI